MSEAKPQNDPSMDDILASIRKIISDDEARAGNAPGPGRPPSMPRPAPAARPFDAGDDVLLLTELIEEPPARAAPRRDPPPIRGPFRPRRVPPRRTRDRSGPPTKRRFRR